MFEDSLYLSTRRDGHPSSTGITASVPYASMNDVSPVDVFKIVQYAHRIAGSSSIHRPFAPSSRFSIPRGKVLLVTSTCQFAWA